METFAVQTFAAVLAVVVINGLAAWAISEVIAQDREHEQYPQ